jgi:hypothetical protein
VRKLQGDVGGGGGGGWVAVTVTVTVAVALHPAGFLSVYVKVVVPVNPPAATKVSTLPERVTVPLAGWVKVSTTKAPPLGSESLRSTEIAIGVTPTVEPVSLTATGGATTQGFGCGGGGALPPHPSRPPFTVPSW